MAASYQASNGVGWSLPDIYQNFSTATRAKFLGIVNDVTKKASLQVKMSAVVEQEPPVKATCRLEEDRSYIGIHTLVATAQLASTLSQAQQPLFYG